MEHDPDAQLVGNALADTPYHCTQLERLSGGYTNSTYRGTLARPLEDGTATVVVKAAKSLVVLGFAVHAVRSVRGISLVVLRGAVLRGSFLLLFGGVKCSFR